MHRSGEGTGVEAGAPGAAASWVMIGLGAVLLVVVTIAADKAVTGGGVAATSLAGMSAVGYGIRRHRPGNARVWWLCLAALALGVVAGALSAVPATADRQVVIDLTYGVGYLLFVAAALSALPRREGQHDWVSYLDTFTVATAGGIALWYFWVSPALRSEVSVHGLVVGLVWPLLDLAMLVIVYRLATSGEPRTFPLAMIVFGLTTNVLIDLIYAARGGGLLGTPLDALWLVPMISLGAAALHPQMRTFGVDTHRVPMRFGAAGAFWVNVASFAVPIVVAAHSLRMGRLEEEAPALIIAVTVLVLVGAARSAEMVRQARLATQRLSAANSELHSAMALLYQVLAEKQRLYDELGRVASHDAFAATHDALTGLPNRRLLRDRLDTVVADRRRPGTALLFLDLDDFKDLNDTLGHQAGDEALVELGKRITETLRPEDLVARLGGDEFAVLVTSTDHEAVIRLGDRLLDAISRPCVVGTVPITLHASIGVAWADRASTADDLLREADLAMYQAKAEGKNRLEIFDPERHIADQVGRFLHAR